MFGRRKPEEEFAAAVYKRTGEWARAPELFEACGIPDTLDGRFDSLALHAALVIERLQREPDGETLAQEFFDVMFKHLDLAEGFHGRALAYREALAGNGTAPLAEVLRRNAYGGRPPADEACVARLESHVRAVAGQLAGMSRNDLAK